MAPCFDVVTARELCARGPGTGRSVQLPWWAAQGVGAPDSPRCPDQGQRLCWAAQEPSDPAETLLGDSFLGV